MNHAALRSALGLLLDADEYLRKPSQDIHEFLEDSEDKYGHSWAGYLYRYSQFYGDNDQIDIEESRITRLIPRGTRYTGIIHEQPDFKGSHISTPFIADHDGYLDKSKGERNLGYLQKEFDKNPFDPYICYQMGVALKSMKRTQEACGYFSKFYDLVGGE